MPGFRGETRPSGVVDQMSQPPYTLVTPVLYNHPDMEVQWSSDFDIDIHEFPWEEYDPVNNNNNNRDMLSELVNFHESQFAQANQETTDWFESNIGKLVGDQDIPDVEDNTNTQSPQPIPAKPALELPPTQYDCSWAEFAPVNNEDLWNMISELNNESTSQPSSSEKEQVPADWIHRFLSDLLGDKDISNLETGPNNSSPQPSTANTVLDPSPNQYVFSSALSDPVKNDVGDMISEPMIGYESTSQLASSENGQVPAPQEITNWIESYFSDLAEDKNFVVEVGSNNPSPQPGPANHHPPANPMLEPLSTGCQNLPADTNSVQHMPLSIPPSQAGINQDLL